MPTAVGVAVDSEGHITDALPRHPSQRLEVGRMQARAVLAAQPKGNYVMIKGSPTDPGSLVRSRTAIALVLDGSSSRKCAAENGR